MGGILIKASLGKRLLLLFSWSVVLLMAASPVPGKEPSIGQVGTPYVCVCSVVSDSLHPHGL